jgi:dipeptidase E
MRLLLLSNSTNPGEEYLGYAGETIRAFLGEKPLKAVFIPYAAVTISFDDYERRVADRFSELGHHVVSIHHSADPAAALEQAEVIITGGGNTWQLLKLVKDNRLLKIIAAKTRGGTPYIGWSAGSNLACPTIMTTNDMPVVNPGSFRATGLIPFQINPHYTELSIPGHGGETRRQRIEEFITANPKVKVAGLSEGTMLHREGEKLRLIGKKPVIVFSRDASPVVYTSQDDLSLLLKRT